MNSEEVGDGVYSGGGTNDARARKPLAGPGPVSMAAWRSPAYRSWNERLKLISIATDRKSAASRLRPGLTGLLIGSRPHMMRARSCWCSGMRFWMSGTQVAQSRRKAMNVVGQFSSERSRSGPDLVVRGRGTEGGFVVHLKAAKKRHSAGPTNTSQLRQRVQEAIRETHPLS